jgi:hypothetical protein
MGILLPHWLSIAITFNHYTSNSPSDYQWKDDGQTVITYAIFTRIMASVYTISLGKGSFLSGYYFRRRCKGCYRRHYASHRQESKERQAIHRQLRAFRR